MGTNSLTRFYRLFKNRFHLIKSPPQIADFSYCLLAIFTNTSQNSKIVLNRNCIKTVLSNFIFFLLSAENVKLQMINFKYFFPQLSNVIVSAKKIRSYEKEDTLYLKSLLKVIE